MAGRESQPVREDGKGKPSREGAGGRSSKMEGGRHGPIQRPELTRSPDAHHEGRDQGKRKGERRGGGQRSGGPVHDQTRRKSNLGNEGEHQAD